MKYTKLNIILFIISIVLSFTPVQASDWDKYIVHFDLGTTIAASGTVSGIVRFPQLGKIDTIYLTDQAGIASDGTDYAVVTGYLNGTAIATWSTLGTGAGVTLAANTPKAVTPSVTNIAVGDVLQFRLTKGGSGQATAGLSATVSYHNTTSR